MTLECVADPFAISHMETLLRLLLLLSDELHQTSKEMFYRTAHINLPIIHVTTSLVGATGGVYKGQGRNQHDMRNCAYKEFIAEHELLQ